MEQNSLLNLSVSELRTLLILKIRNFTNALELGVPLGNLETLREEVRTITEVLRAKELGDPQRTVETTTQSKGKGRRNKG